MIKKIRPRYAVASMNITIPKKLAIEAEIFGDREIEVEVGKNNELILRKCEKELSDAMKLIKIFGKSYFLERRIEKSKLRREERTRKWKEKLAQIKAQRNSNQE